MYNLYIEKFEICHPLEHDIIEKCSLINKEKQALFEIYLKKANAM